MGDATDALVIVRMQRCFTTTSSDIHGSRSTDSPVALRLSFDAFADLARSRSLSSHLCSLLGIQPRMLERSRNLVTFQIESHCPFRVLRTPSDPAWPCRIGAGKLFFRERAFSGVNWMVLDSIPVRASSSRQWGNRCLYALTIKHIK